MELPGRADHAPQRGDRLMKNRELFLRDPVVSKLLNDGVAAVREDRER